MPAGFARSRSGEGDEAMKEFPTLNGASSGRNDGVRLFSHEMINVCL